MWSERLDGRMIVSSFRLRTVDFRRYDMRPDQTTAREYGGAASIRSKSVADNFFDEQSEQSLIKAEIISKYFWAWAKVIVGCRSDILADRRTGSPTSTSLQVQAGIGMGRRPRR